MYQCAAMEPHIQPGGPECAAAAVGPTDAPQRPLKSLSRLFREFHFHAGLAIHWSINEYDEDDHMATLTNVTTKKSIHERTRTRKEAGALARVLEVFDVCFSALSNIDGGVFWNEYSRSKRLFYAA
ncbi:unnamed protein product [Amoebophrya sp. A25]|nr:unnamed protein product [Amoebophrya sp. A25]|eukprot:GSA25T00006550001.1